MKRLSCEKRGSKGIGSRETGDHMSDRNESKQQQQKLINKIVHLNTKLQNVFEHTQKSTPEQI